MSEPVVLAVDGGNSKTDLALVRGGRRAARARPRAALARRTTSGSTASRRPAPGPARRGGRGAGSRQRRPVADGRARSSWPASTSRPRSEQLHAAVAERGWAARIDASATTRFARPARRHRARLGRRRRLRRRDQLRRRRARTVATCASPRSARSPATGAAATTSASRRSPPPRAARTAAAPPTSLEQRGPGALRAATPPDELAEAIHGGRIAHRRLIELAPVVFAEAAHDAVGGGDRRAAGGRGRRARAGRADAPRPRPGARSRCCSAAACCAPATSGCSAAIEAGLPRSATAIAVHTHRRRRRSSARRCSGSTGSGRDDGAQERARRELIAAADADDDLESTASAWSPAMADVRFEHATRIYPGSDVAGGRRARPPDRRRRVDGARRPVGLGQVDGAAHARRARGGRRRRRSGSAAATSPTRGRRTATSRWSSRTTRSTRT